MSECWIHKKVSPQRVREWLEKRGKGNTGTSFNSKAWNDFIRRKQNGMLIAPDTNTTIPCPNNCGYFLHFFRITKRAFVTHAKEKRENEEPLKEELEERLRFMELISGFGCPVCGVTFFKEKFNDGMVRYVEKMSRKVLETDKPKTERQSGLEFFMQE